jgi:Flp pilus assembly pilin Flp
MAFFGWLERIRFRCVREKAQTMAEYAVVLGLIVPGIIIAYAVFSERITAAYLRVIAFFT